MLGLFGVMQLKWPLYVISLRATQQPVELIIAQPDQTEKGVKLFFHNYN